MKISLADTTGMKDPDTKRAIKKTSVLKIDGPWSVGIEYELENLQGRLFNASEIDKAAWEGKTDGSLRGGNAREYVFKTPLSGDDCVAALENIYTAAKNDMSPFMSLRTSAHIHVNCLDLSIREALLFAAAGVMLENHIYTLEDPYRKWCGFCAKSDEHMGQYIESAIEANGIPALQIPRYLGINVMALKKFGTIEFRQFSVPATLEQAVSNVNLCISLKKAAIEIAEATKVNEIKTLTLEKFKPVIYALYEKLKETHGSYAVEMPDVMLKYAESSFHEKNEKWSNLVKEEEENTQPKREGIDALGDWLNNRPQIGINPIEAGAGRTFRFTTAGTERAEMPERTTTTTDDMLAENFGNQIQPEHVRYAPYNPARMQDGTLLLPSIETFVQAGINSLYITNAERRLLNEMVEGGTPINLLRSSLAVNLLTIKPQYQRMLLESGLTVSLDEFLRARTEGGTVFKLSGTRVSVHIVRDGPISVTLDLRLPGERIGWNVVAAKNMEMWKFIASLQIQLTGYLQAVQRGRINVEEPDQPNEPGTF